jgi:signal transduction histidine kinase
MQQEFLAMVTHELRNPLTAITGYAHLMQSKGSYDERATDTILRRARHLNRMIGDLLDAARLEAHRLELQREPTELISLIRGCADQVQVLSNRHTVRFDARDREVRGLWDGERLEQVFENLLLNAVKYSPDGGEIVVRIEKRDRQVRVAISDPGVGIAPEALSRLFSRFYRAATVRGSDIQGVGLGLYICRSLVEAHGGTIEVESAPGHGSTFRVILPHAELP